MAGLDDTLSFEAVYYAAPIPRSPATLTILGAVFDKVYFPGVYLPVDGFDKAVLKQEIRRLESLPGARSEYDFAMLIGILKMALHARTLEGFCVFTGAHDEPFPNQDSITGKMVSDIAAAIHGPPPQGFIPTFSTNNLKAIPGSDEYVAFPGTYHYLAGAILESSERRVPLLNDEPQLPIPGIEKVPPKDQAKVLSAILAIECTKLVLPPTPILRPHDIMEFRESNKALLRAFRKSMLRYSADLNEKIGRLSIDEYQQTTRFFLETEIVPAMDDLRAALNDPARPWHKRAIDGVKVIPSIAGAYFTGGTSAALVKALTAYASQFLVELAAHGDKRDALKRSGLYYLLQLRKFYDEKS
ncbi:MAG: hypothetical protein U1E67_12420 [Hyphomicrobiales bacterium]